jgi:hypothetical protein
MTRELQALVRLREDHVKAKVAASNQLGALLDAHWPGAKAIFSRLASEVALAFLEAYPTPQAAVRLARHGWRPSAAGTPTAVAAARPSCSPGCA